MFKVFVLSTDGFVQHGPVRSSEAQAKHVANLLSRRLGWVAVASVEVPAPPDPVPADVPVPAQASLSPVWKDPELAARWASAPRRGRAMAAASGFQMPALSDSACPLLYSPLSAEEDAAIEAANE